MNKYIEADKLIAEINGIIATVKVKNHPDEFGSIGQCLAAAEIEALNLTLDYIKELQQEQPDNEDIDKVAQELYEHLYELKRRNNVPTNLYDKQEIIDLWKAGVEYGRNHPKQEQPTSGYDEAYLNECIAKARKTWKGVDIDKYMDEMRGREQEQPKFKV